MLKELLLQFVVSLLPAVSFQLWHDTDHQSKRTPLFLSLLSGLSMLLCILLAYDFNGYDLDFRVVPYIIGSLYGGVPALVSLSVLYSVIRASMLDTLWETVSLVVFLLTMVPVLLALLRPFREGSRREKMRISILLISCVMVLYLIAVAVHMRDVSVPWEDRLVAIFAISALACPLAMYIAVYIIESLRSNKRLQYEVQLVSTNYRYEVEKLQQLIDETAFAVMIVDRDGRLTHINDMGMKLFALKPNNGSTAFFVGWHYTEIFRPNASDLCVKLLGKALKGERSALEPLVGEKAIYLKTGFPLLTAENDSITGAALIIQDITEITRLRDEVGRMERLSLVGQMAASITHEIRNPMAVIRGFVQLMRERSPADQQQYFRIVMDELDRANTIISDFLSLAQNRALAMERGSLHDIIHNLLPLLEADANMRGQTIELDLCPDMPFMLLNEKEMKQLLLNLARNGMEAMGDKGVLHIRTVFEDNRVELHIQDEGIGIPHDKIKHLFEPFFTTKQQGTGLGLSLCLSIAERHSGRIDVVSEQGQGTAFIVTFELPDIMSRPAAHTTG